MIRYLPVLLVNQGPHTGSALDLGAAYDEATSEAALVSLNDAIKGSLDIVGTIYFLDKQFPKQALDRVTTSNDRRRQSPVINGATGEAMNLDRASGSATEGMPSNIFKAGGDQTTGRVIFNLVIQ